MPAMKQKKRQLSSSSDDEILTSPHQAKFKVSASSRKIVKTAETAPAQDKDMAQKMDNLIKAQILKFKPAKKKKRLNSGKKEKLTIKEAGKRIVEQQECLQRIFEPKDKADPVAEAMARADIDPEGKINTYPRKKYDWCSV